jgi:ATP-binding cassette subfamily B protein
MGSLRSDRTSFVIAQRLSTLRDAGLIPVMEAGQIVVATAFSGGLSKIRRPW